MTSNQKIELNNILNIQVIRPELNNFIRDTKINFDKTSSSKGILFSKLFCKYHERTVWFYENGVYKVSFDLDDSINSLPIKVYKVNTFSNGLVSAPGFRYRGTYTILFLIIILSSLQNGGEIPLVISLIGLGVTLIDDINLLIYKFRLKVLDK